MMSNKVSEYEVGAFYKVNDYRGELRNFTGKLVACRDLEKEPLTPRVQSDIKIPKSRYLLLFERVDKKEMKSFYHQYVSLELVPEVEG